MSSRGATERSWHSPLKWNETATITWHCSQHLTCLAYTTCCLCFTSLFPNTHMRLTVIMWKDRFFQSNFKVYFRYKETSYIRIQLKSCTKPGEIGVNPGTCFLNPETLFLNPEQTQSKPRAKPGPKLGLNPVDDPRYPARILANPGSTRSGLVRQSVPLLDLRA